MNSFSWEIPLACPHCHSQELREVSGPNPRSKERIACNGCGRDLGSLPAFRKRALDAAFAEVATQVKRAVAEAARDLRRKARRR